MWMLDDGDGFDIIDVIILIVVLGFAAALFFCVGLAFG